MNVQLAMVTGDVKVIAFGVMETVYLFHPMTKVIVPKMDLFKLQIATKSLIS